MPSQLNQKIRHFGFTVTHEVREVIFEALHTEVRISSKVRRFRDSFRMPLYAYCELHEEHSSRWPWLKNHLKTNLRGRYIEL